jgi:hypothetical protein
MVTSTGRSSRVQHSTGMAGSRTERKSHRRPRTRYSTGRQSTICHFTGRRSDMRRHEKHAQAKAGRAAPEDAAHWEPRQPA